MDINPMRRLAPNQFVGVCIFRLNAAAVRKSKPATTGSWPEATRASAIATSSIRTSAAPTETQMQSRDGAARRDRSVHL